jgi:hypothetical protein
VGNCAALRPVAYASRSSIRSRRAR